MAARLCVGGYSSLLVGSGSHKVSSNDREANPLLRFYYSFPYALFLLVATNEGFLVGLYTLKFTYVAYERPGVCGAPVYADRV